MRDDDGFDGTADPGDDARADRAPVAAGSDGHADELDALSTAVDDAFRDAVVADGAGAPDLGPHAGAAASLSASARALDGTDQMLRETRHMMQASLDAMHEGGMTYDAARGPRASAAVDDDGGRDDDGGPTDDGDDDGYADEDAEESRRARDRAARLTDRATETIDFEDADDDPLADPPSRPPDSLMGAIRWDDDGEPGPLRIAVAGGRGGVGRTLLVANAALVLARLGRRCAVVDLDPVGAGLHGALGLAPRLPGPAQLLDPPPTTAEPVPGVPLHLLRPGRPVCAGPADPARAECLANARERDDEVLLLDLGAQADPFTLDTWLDADVSVVVAEPLPAAIERTYGFLRAALWRRLLDGRRAVADSPTEVARRVIADTPAIDSPGALVEALEAVDADAARAIRARLMAFTPRLLMNRTRSRIDREMGPAMVSALRRRWSVTAEFIGAIDDDDAVREAAGRRRPLLLAYPGAGYSLAIEKVARTLDRLAEARRGRP